MKNRINELESNLRKRMAINSSKSTVIKLRKSLTFDKMAMSSEDAVLLDTANSLTSILYDELGISTESESINDLLVSKESIIDTIKKMFKSKINLTESKFNDVIKYVDENYDDNGDVSIEIKYYIKDVITKLRTMGYECKLTISDLINSTILAFAEANKELSSYNKLLFKFTSMLDTKPLVKIGYGVKDKLKLLDNKNIETFCDFKLKDIEKFDKKNDLHVSEYRILPLGLLDDSHISFYILRYVTNGDLYTMIPRWHEYKIKHPPKVEDTSLELVQGDYGMIKNEYESRMNKSERLFVPGSVFEESYNEIKINKELDDYISSLGNINYDKSKLYNDIGYDYQYGDLTDEWALEYTSPEPLFKFIANVSLVNYYENVSQNHYGDFDLKYDFIYDIFYSVVYGIAKIINNK